MQEEKVTLRSALISRFETLTPFFATDHITFLSLQPHPSL